MWDWRRVFICSVKSSVMIKQAQSNGDDRYWVESPTSFSTFTDLIRFLTHNPSVLFPCHCIYLSFYPFHRHYCCCHVSNSPTVLSIAFPNTNCDKELTITTTIEAVILWLLMDHIIRKGYISVCESMRRKRLHDTSQNIKPK